MNIIPKICFLIFLSFSFSSKDFKFNLTISLIDQAKDLKVIISSTLFKKIQV